MKYILITLLLISNISMAQRRISVRAVPCHDCNNQAIFSCDSIKNCVDYIPNNDSTIWVYGSDTLFIPQTTPQTTNQILLNKINGLTSTVNGQVSNVPIPTETITNFIGFNSSGLPVSYPLTSLADNDLGIGIDGKVETGFPLHRYTETDQSGFQRHWHGGRFSWAYGDYSTNFNNNQIGLFRTNSAQNQRIYIDNVQTYIDATNSTRTSYIYNAPSYCSLNTRLLSTGQTASVSTNYNQILNTLQEATNLSLTHQFRVEDTRNIIHRFNNGTTPQTDSRYMSFSQIIQNGIPTQTLSTTQSTSTLLAKPTIAGNHTLIVNNNNNIPSSTTSALDVYGDAWVFGGTWNISDSTIKKNIAPLEYGLSDIIRLNTVTFQFKENNETKPFYTDKKQYGLIAQDVINIIPEAITRFKITYETGEYRNTVQTKTDENGNEVTVNVREPILNTVEKLGINKDMIYIVLINAVKQLESRIRELENR